MGAQQRQAHPTNLGQIPVLHGSSCGFRTLGDQSFSLHRHGLSNVIKPSLLEGWLVWAPRREQTSGVSLLLSSGFFSSHFCVLFISRGPSHRLGVGMESCPAWPVFFPGPTCGSHCRPYPSLTVEWCQPGQGTGLLSPSMFLFI